MTWPWPKPFAPEVQLLTEAQTTALAKQPETGMGYHIVTVTTKTGVYPHVVIAGDTILAVRDDPKIPFTAADIVQIELTHAKW
jgi:hypothetical protein